LDDHGYAEFLETTRKFARILLRRRGPATAYVTAEPTFV
jgi:hypothetical protein